VSTADSEHDLLKPSEITEAVAEKLASDILKAAKSSKTEQDLVVGVELALSPVLDRLEIPKHVEREKTLLEGPRRRRYGSVIIEYEAPGKLGTSDL
jgi:hypothetical protein